MNAPARPPRRGVTSALLAAAAVTAVLATSACETSGNDGAAAESSAPAADKPAGQDPADDSTAGDSGEIQTCAPASLKVTVTKPDLPGLDAERHFLVTVRNNGDATCTVWSYPYIKFDGARRPIAVIDETSGDPVDLAPGGQAYAGLQSMGGGMDTMDTNGIPVDFMSEYGGETESKPLGEPAGVSMPDTTPFDDGARVTYWTGATGSALDPLKNL
ncbi:hypothetical protein SRB5_04360 [Streptomyces sp. RB5]|uniref:DUF4232 domain-containing protein n=1 Tax=Streptomyces smaragdinus TaxID=2585196 RepID=A0A7K0CA54_9ACTN|nr:DUF4232 domain-containing protein [Streptomyces smaragdinus]MQY10329.1 hypothetical protein [Streptomyces smaragdinus]